MRLLICGDRHWSDLDFIQAKLAALDPRPELVIEGGARGADRLGNEAAVWLQIPVRTFYAEWNTYGRRAGPIRNTQMLVEGKPDLVWAFHDCLNSSRGTKNMVVQAQKAGIPVTVWTHD